LPLGTHCVAGRVGAGDGAREPAVRIVVVGGGVSGAHAALTLLERGLDVELWDVGREEAAFAEPGTTFHELKRRLPDPVAHYLGADLGALIPPANPELLRYPPSRNFLAPPDDPLWGFEADGFFPYASFAKGGLANGWGANALSFDADDLAEWPVSESEMDAAYRTVYQRVRVAGPVDDDLTPYLHGVYPSEAPVRLSFADERMLRSYQRSRSKLQRSGLRIGRARLAVITDPSRGDACDYCDRCLWGCPRSAIYNPRLTTLAQCEAYGKFRYVSERLVLALLSDNRRIRGIRYVDTATEQLREEPCDAVFLAAGALQTGAVFLRTLKAAGLDIALHTEGLMDTAIVKIPFVSLGAIGRAPDPRSFQFNRLILGVIADTAPWPRYLHGELLHLTSLLYYPLIERMPFDSRLSKKLFFTLRSSLGAATLFFPDRIVAGNHQALVDGGGRWEGVRLTYRETVDKEHYIQQSVARVRSALWRLGCLPRGVVRSSAGAGIHYAGTVPMGNGPKRCDPKGRSNFFPNLYVADGAAFPSLPSKSITMSLAAHATRVARGAEL
jgi:choline dehydrogenase-like flavoprotein